MKDPVLRCTITGKRELRALGGLHYIRGNKLPHFCLTIASWTFVNGIRREDTFGADHEALVAQWPELKPLADLHLSDIDGVPMHAEANGWYWLAGCTEDGLQQQYHGSNSSFPKSKEECLDIFAKYMRISVEGAYIVRHKVLEVAAEFGNKAAREWFKSYVEEQRPRWAREAKECIETLGLQIYGDTYQPQLEAA
jgi:hypothetical protein